ncbi:MAG: Stf0 sulfotransferase family protein [Bacteroidia bacterium]|nr:Stf0 sulfotransferase family protein [Bacteroidia bacterium]
MNKPILTYRIWMTQRTGSTLLCKGLESTGIAGKPGEHFNLIHEKNLQEKYGVEGFEKLQQELWKVGSTPNGVFGMKLDQNGSIYPKWVKEVAELQGLASDTDNEAVFAELFPNCKHIYLTRRNKIRQAVSWWKAIKDEVWHLEQGQEFTDKEEFYKENYVPAALDTLVRQTVRKEADIQEFFSSYGYEPLSIVYEDMIQNFEGTIKRIVDFLEIPYQKLDVGDMFYKVTATQKSEEWVEKFTEEFYHWE